MIIEQRLQLYREFVAGIHDLWSWCYNDQFDLLYTNCTYKLVLNSIFTVPGRKNAILEHAKESSMPLVISDAFGLVWITVFEKEAENLKHIHVIGPVYTEMNSRNSQDLMINPRGISPAEKEEIIHCILNTPVIERAYLLQYVTVLHLCVTSEKIQISDICYLESSDIHFNDINPKLNLQQLQDTWGIEETLLKMVREGDLQYQEIFSRASVISNGIHINNCPQIRQAKNSVIIFISLCKRAAIEGGLSFELADNLCNLYMEKVENCTNISGITAISNNMYSDFIHRVHKCKKNSNISKQIQTCCDYIEMHIEEVLSVHEIASRVGYTDYYLTRKFKKEVGCSINDYIKKQKIEHAKMLLTYSDKSIQSISETLHFCTRSYFADTFQKITQMTPSEYRESKRRI